MVRWLGFVPNRDISGWVLLTFSIVIGLIANLIITQVVQFVLRRRPVFWLQTLRKYCHWAFVFFVPSLFFLFSTNLQNERFLMRHPIADKTAEVLFLMVSTWLLVQLLKATEVIVIREYDPTQDSDLTQRKFVTQVKFMRRAVALSVIVIGVSLLLLSFQGSRKVGMSILTSAGIVSVVIGFAAQKSLSSLLAGIQIAFSQQIRIDDAVVVENEWGRVEEINLTTVVVRIWDRRRLILPITYFVEKPFQNWTRTESSITGIVLLYLDYSVPVEKIREKALALAEAEPLWDGNVFAVQVTETTETGIVVRVLVSARDAGSAFDLRCHIREALITFLREEHPESLPKTRVSVVNEQLPVINKQLLVINEHLPTSISLQMD
jgi:small-conductance mechanosensitive channel